MADQLVEAGAQEICLKDMAGIGRPTMLGEIVKYIKTKYPNIIVQYHGHTGPGFSVASMLEIAKAGGDVFDVAIEPLSWGMVHPDVITIQQMFKEAGKNSVLKSVEFSASQYGDVENLNEPLFSKKVMTRLNLNPYNGGIEKIESEPLK